MNKFDKRIFFNKLKSLTLIGILLFQLGGVFSSKAQIATTNLELNFDAANFDGAGNPATNTTTSTTWSDLANPPASDGTLNNFTLPTLLESGWDGTGIALNPHRLKFDGVDDYVDICANCNQPRRAKGEVYTDIAFNEVHNNFTFRNNDDSTFEAWFRLRETAPGEVETIVSNSNKGGPTNFLFNLLGVSSNAANLEFTYTSFNVEEDDDSSSEGQPERVLPFQIQQFTTHTYRNTDVQIPTNQWTHVAFTYRFGDPTTAMLYINGCLVSGSYVSGNGDDAPGAFAHTPRVGAEHDNGSFLEPRLNNPQLQVAGMATSFFSGDISIVRIYGSQLSENNVRNNYLNDFGRFQSSAVQCIPPSTTTSGGTSGTTSGAMLTCAANEFACGNVMCCPATVGTPPCCPSDLSRCVQDPLCPDTSLTPDSTTSSSSSSTSSGSVSCVPFCGKDGLDCTNGCEVACPTSTSESCQSPEGIGIALCEAADGTFTAASCVQTTSSSSGDLGTDSIIGLGVNMSGSLPNILLDENGSSSGGTSSRVLGQVIIDENPLVLANSNPAFQITLPDEFPNGINVNSIDVTDSLGNLFENIPFTYSPVTITPQDFILTLELPGVSLGEATTLLNADEGRFQFTLNVLKKLKSSKLIIMASNPIIGTGQQAVLMAGTNPRIRRVRVRQDENGNVNIRARSKRGTFVIRRFKFEREDGTIRKFINGDRSPNPNTEATFFPEGILEITRRSVDRVGARFKVQAMIIDPTLIPDEGLELILSVTTPGGADSVPIRIFPPDKRKSKVNFSNQFYSFR